MGGGGGGGVVVCFVSWWTLRRNTVVRPLYMCVWALLFMYFGTFMGIKWNTMTFTFAE
jgi:hypothetical protein